MEPEERNRILRALPAVGEFLRHPRIQSHLQILARGRVIHSIRQVLERKRRMLRTGDEGPAGFSPEILKEALVAEVEEELAAAAHPSLRPVINATGVVLHTNLGRAPLSPSAREQLQAISGRYSNLEMDLASGERGSRYRHVEENLCQLAGAESALVVNNNAGAVLLALNSLAEGREVIVSRGQLVEIGGSFRIPDVMRKSGARLVEVGTTNRTHLMDYERAIGPETALLLRVHTSNFRILGFTAQVPVTDLAALGQARSLPVMEDLGSGCFLDLSAYGLEKEPTVPEVLRAGADVVTFSGDKLLGGPQAGIILGRRKYLDLLKGNPLNRALRIDKLTLAGLEATLRPYWNGRRAVEEIPVLSLLTRPVAELERRARRLRRELLDLEGRCRVEVKEENSQVGGGALPLLTLPSRALALGPREISPAVLEERLRRGLPPVIGRVKEEEVLLDLRTVFPEEEKVLLRAVRQALQ